MGTIGNITFACADPDALASFWAAAIGYEREEAPPELMEAIEEAGGDPNAAAAAIDPEGSGPRLYFKKGPRSSPEHIPIHLDVNVEDREAAVDRFAAMGATVVETKSETIGPYTETWTVMRDPEGNGFCVQSPE